MLYLSAVWGFMLTHVPVHTHLGDFVPVQFLPVGNSYCFTPRHWSIYKSSSLPDASVLFLPAPSPTTSLQLKA